jgi:ammonium transporter, Amt family
MSDYSLLTAGLAFLMPVGFALIAVGGLPKERARYATVSVLAALGLSSLGYVITGFALQFGGVGLAYSHPGLQELIWEWSLLGTTWGTGWGMAGLVGWGMTGPAATSGAYALALANLPWVTTAALIPLLALQGRMPKFGAALLALLIGGVIYPLAGNWVWGGGWLANLGHNLNQGHGLVDAGGAGLVHLVGASATLAAIVTFTTRRPRPSAENEPIPLPTVHFPALALFGAALLLVGSLAWTTANPLIRSDMLTPGQIALNSALVGAGGAFLSLLYTWFVAGRPDPLMATRGLAAGIVAAAAAAPFIPPWAALALGASLGLLTPLAIFVVDHLLRWDDATAALTVHGLGGSLGLLAVGLLADGRSGVGWNGIGLDGYLGVARQGVTGLLAAPGLGPDWPGQMQAQMVGLAALALFAMFAAWLLLAPPTLLAHFLDRLSANSKALRQPVIEDITTFDDENNIPPVLDTEHPDPTAWEEPYPDGLDISESEPLVAEFSAQDDYDLPQDAELDAAVIEDGDSEYEQQI